MGIVTDYAELNVQHLVDLGLPQFTAAAVIRYIQEQDAQSGGGALQSRPTLAPPFPGAPVVRQWTPHMAPAEQLVEEYNPDSRDEIYYELINRVGDAKVIVLTADGSQIDKEATVARINTLVAKQALANFVTLDGVSRILLKVGEKITLYTYNENPLHMGEELAPGDVDISTGISFSDVPEEAQKALR